MDFGLAVGIGGVVMDEMYRQSQREKYSYPSSYDPDDDSPSRAPTTKRDPIPARTPDEPKETQETKPSAAAAPSAAPTPSAKPKPPPTRWDDQLD